MKPNPGAKSQAKVLETVRNEEKDHNNNFFQKEGKRQKERAKKKG